MNKKILSLFILGSVILGASLVHAQTGSMEYPLIDSYGNTVTVEFEFYRDLYYDDVYPFTLMLEMFSLQSGHIFHVHEAIVKVPNFQLTFTLAAEFNQTGQSGTFTLNYRPTKEANSGTLNLMLTYTTFINGGQYHGDSTKHITEVTLAEGPSTTAEIQSSTIISLFIAVGSIITILQLHSLKKSTKTKNLG